MKFFYTLILTMSAVLTSQANMAAQTQLPVVHWLGSLPTEQVQPVVDSFNQKHSSHYGFQVEYVANETHVNGLLTGETKTEGFDLVQMKDAELLRRLDEKGLAAELSPESLKNWPSHLRDTNHKWVGLLKRARIIYYNSDLVSADEIPTYESLGNPRFAGKLCLRQKKAQYNQSLHAFFVGVWGEAKTLDVLRSWAVNSEALPLIEKDLDGVIAQIESGNCAVGVANTYYYLRHVRNNPQTKVKPLFPNQNDIGAHVNVDGIALLKVSQQLPKAQIFAEWLMSHEAQKQFAELTDKHPVLESATSLELNRIFGSFSENTSFDLSHIPELKAKGSALAEEAGLK